MGRRTVGTKIAKQNKKTANKTGDYTLFLYLHCFVEFLKQCFPTNLNKKIAYHYLENLEIVIYVVGSYFDLDKIQFCLVSS